MRLILAAALVCAGIAAAALGALERTLEPSSAGIKVRWAPAVDDAVRLAAERRYGLSEGSPGDTRTWSYTLTDPSQENVRALVGDAAVEDTADIDRAAFRPSRESTRGRWPRSESPLATAALRVVVVLAGFLAPICAGVGLAGLAAPHAMAALFTRRPAPSAPLSRTHRALLVLLVGGSLALNVASMRRMTLTVDEPEHLRYGRNILNLDSARFDDSKMPISALNAVPGALAERLPPGPVASYLARPETARYVTVGFSALTALCVFAWARRLYGALGALLALTLYAFDPNLLAHAQVTTTDLYAAGTIAIALYYFWRFLREGGWGLALTSALALGLAQVAKYTAVTLFPLFALIAVLFYSRELGRAWRNRRVGDLWQGVVAFSVTALVFIGVSVVVVNVGFLFNQTLTPLDQYSFHSQVFKSLQASAGLLGRLPLPSPYPYLEGLDLVMDHERTGVSFGRAYLFGQLREGGFPGYYLWAWLVKVPLATHVLLLAAGATYIARRRKFEFLEAEAVLLVPVAFFLVYFNFFYRAQIGIRYFLVVSPLLYVFAGCLLAHRPAVSKPLAASLTAAIAALVLSVLSYYPHFLPYFNELVWDRTQAFRVLADSNLDWGQYGVYLDDYRAGHPGTVFEPETPSTGTILVRVNMLTGVTGDPERFRWLRESFNPTEHIAHGILVYHVNPADLERLRLGH
jgi:hypothetical protein